MIAQTGKNSNRRFAFFRLNIWNDTTGLWERIIIGNDRQVDTFTKIVKGFIDVKKGTVNGVSQRKIIGRSKNKILIIDDEQINLDFFDVMLTRLGFEVLMAVDGEEGLEMIKEHNPDLIILDIMMPEKGGALVYQEIKADGRFKNIPLLIFSGVDPQAFAHYIKMLNASSGESTPLPKYYVEKSADPDYLKKVITDCMDDPNA